MRLTIIATEYAANSPHGRYVAARVGPGWEVKFYPESMKELQRPLDVHAVDLGGEPCDWPSAGAAHRVVEEHAHLMSEGRSAIDAAAWIARNTDRFGADE